MSSKYRVFVVTLLGLSLLLTPLLSYAGGDEAAWLSLSVGRGAQAERPDNELLNAMAIALGASVQPGRTIFSFRYTRLGSESATGDIALLLERPIEFGGARVTAGAGIGLLYGNAVQRWDPALVEKSIGGGDVAYHDAGAAWHVELTTNSSSNVRAGIQGFGAVADRGDFWGLALVLHIGPVGGERGRQNGGLRRSGQ